MFIAPKSNGIILSVQCLRLLAELFLIQRCANLAVVGELDLAPGKQLRAVAWLDIANVDSQVLPRDGLVVDVLNAFTSFSSSCCAAKEVLCTRPKPNSFAFEEVAVAGDEPHGDTLRRT